MTDAEIEKALTGFRPLADWWAGRIQWSEDDHEDLVQEGMLSLLKTLRGYQKSEKPIRDLSGLASTCLACAMKWYYKPKDRLITEVSIDNIELPVDGMDEYLSEIWTNEFIRETGRVLGAVAQEVVQNLLSPSPAVISLAIEEMEQKAVRQRNGERVLGHSTLRITKDHVRRFVHLTEGQWQTTFSQIRSFTAQYLRRESGRSAVPRLLHAS